MKKVILPVLDMDIANILPEVDNTHKWEMLAETLFKCSRCGIIKKKSDITSSVLACDNISCDEAVIRNIIK